MTLLTAATMATMEAFTAQREPTRVPVTWKETKHENHVSANRVEIDWTKGSDLLKQELKVGANSKSKPVKFDDRILLTCFDYEVLQEDVKS